MMGVYMTLRKDLEDQEEKPPLPFLTGKAYIEFMSKKLQECGYARFWYRGPVIFPGPSKIYETALRKITPELSADKTAEIANQLLEKYLESGDEDFNDYDPEKNYQKKKTTSNTLG